MYCPSCGKSIEASVRFCPNCGASVAAATGGAYSAPSAVFGTRGTLLRLREPRMIAGVCSGFAAYYGWDVSLVRVITAAVMILTSGLGGLAYLAAWIIIPEAPYMLPANTGYAAVVPPPSYGGPGDSTGTPAI